LEVAAQKIEKWEKRKLTRRAAVYIGGVQNTKSKPVDIVVGGLCHTGQIWLGGREVLFFGPCSLSPAIKYWFHVKKRAEPEENASEGRKEKKALAEGT